MKDREVNVKVVGVYSRPTLRPEITCDNAVNLSSLMKRNTFVERDLKLIIDLGYTITFSGAVNMLTKEFIKGIETYAFAHNALVGSGCELDNRTAH